jgi:hypothetical protein
MDAPLTRPPRRSKRRRARRVLLPAALTVLLALGLAACGGDDEPTDAVASLGDTEQASDDSGDGTDRGDDEVTEEDRQQAALDFARCMREHGVDMPDPTFDGEGGTGMIIQGGATGGGPDQETMEAAQEACGSIMEDVLGEGARDMDPEQVEEMQQRALDFAKCMREHGIDMPDPVFEGGGRVTQGFTLGDSDPAAFEAAQSECAEEVGMEGGPGGGPSIAIGPGGGSSASSEGGDE